MSEGSHLNINGWNLKSICRFFLKDIWQWLFRKLRLTKRVKRVKPTNCVVQFYVFTFFGCLLILCWMFLQKICFWSLSHRIWGVGTHLLRRNKNKNEFINVIMCLHSCVHLFIFYDIGSFIRATQCSYIVIVVSIFTCFRLYDTLFDFKNFMTPFCPDFLLSILKKCLKYLNYLLKSKRNFFTY